MQQPIIRVQQQPANATQPNADVFEDQHHYDVVTGIASAATAGMASILGFTVGICYALPILAVPSVLFGALIVADRTLNERHISPIPTWLKRGVEFLISPRKFLTSDNGAAPVNQVQINMRRARPRP